MQSRSPIATNRQMPPLASGLDRGMDIFVGELVSKSAVLAPFQSIDLGANRQGARTPVASPAKMIRLARKPGLLRGKRLSKLTVEAKPSVPDCLCEFVHCSYDFMVPTVVTPFGP